MPKLTKKFIDRIKSDGKDTFLWDDELPGFGLRILPSGYRSFQIQYRNNAGRTRRSAIGAYGRLTPHEARSMARQMLADVERGLDLAQQKEDNRAVLTMANLSNRYLTEHAEVKKKAGSIRNDKQMIRDYVLPNFRRLKATAITHSDIARLHHELRDKPILANRLLALLSKMFNLSEKWGSRPMHSNPCRFVEKYKEQKRERYLSGEELARLGQVLGEAEQDEMPSAILAIRLLMFTGCRLSEILTLKWEQVDFEKGVILLPDTKNGYRMVPMPGVAIDLLINAPRVNNYVCFGDKENGHLIGLPKIWRRIRAKASLEDVRLHDLRHSFASVAAAANMGLPIIGKLLGHSQAQTTQRYAHLALDPLKAASEEIARRIDEAMKMKPKQGKVINIMKKNDSER